MGLSGLVAGGMQEGLEQVLERRLKEAIRQQQAQQHAEQVAMQREQMAGMNADRAEGRENQRRTIDLNELKRRDDLNVQGMEQMNADKMQIDQQTALAGLPPRLRQIADLRKVGVTGISPADLNTPDEIAAALQAKQAQAIAEEGRAGQEWERRNSITNAQADARQSRSDALMRGRADEARDDKPPTAAQSTLASYASRIEQAEPTIQTLEKHIVGMNPMSFEAQLWTDRPTFQSKEVQQYAQASRNLINSVLRRESGAVISPSEFAEARQQYLPQPGDDAKVLEMKRANRALNAATYKKGAGKAYQSLDDALGTIDKGTTVNVGGGKGDLGLGDVLVYDPKTKSLKKRGG